MNRNKERKREIDMWEIEIELMYNQNFVCLMIIANFESNNSKQYIESIDTIFKMYDQIEIIKWWEWEN